MKKIFATLLSASMLLSMASVGAFAAENKTLTSDRTWTYGEARYKTDGCDPDADTAWNDPYTNVSVNVSWSDTNFTYDFGQKWDPETHKYVDQPGWNKDYIDVTVTNHSNCPVGAEVLIGEVYTSDTTISFENNKNTANLTSAIDEDNVEAGNNAAEFTIKFDYTPKSYVEDLSNFFTFEVSISGTLFKDPEPETPAVVNNEDGEHEHHFVYDQFGRLVCTGCDKIKHEYCIDEDEDGICDECGLERDFCPDCHVGGKCVCT